MLCTKCKKEIEEDAIYCKYCGFKVGKKNISAVGIIISTMFIIFIVMLFAPSPKDIAYEKIPYTNFVQKINNNEIDKVVIVVSKINAIPKKKAIQGPEIHYYIDTAEIKLNELMTNISNKSIEANVINQAEDTKNSPLGKLILFVIIFIYIAGIFRFIKNKKTS